MLYSSSLIPSPLLRLPAELRIAIYEYVFGDMLYNLHVHRGFAKTHPSFNACNLGLIATSRQLHSETRLLPYELGMFHFWVDIPDRSEDQCSFRIRQFVNSRTEEQKAAIGDNMRVFTNSFKYNPWTVLHGISIWTLDDWQVAIVEQLDEQWLDQELW